MDGGVVRAGDDVEDRVGADDQLQGLIADFGVEALYGMGDDGDGRSGDGLAGNLSVRVQKSSKAKKDKD
jgi:hypothetical protein